MKKHNQNGFTHILASLVVIIIVLITFTGWYVWHRGSVRGQSSIHSANSLSSSDSSLDNSGYKVANVIGNLALIKEWGVKIPVSSDLHLIYKYTPSSAQKTVSTVDFSSKELVSLPSCHASDVTRERGLASDIYDQSSSSKKTFKEIWDADRRNNLPGDINVGDYYYESFGGHGSCTDPSKQTKEYAYYDQLYNSVIKMVAE